MSVPILISLPFSDEFIPLFRPLPHFHIILVLLSPLRGGGAGYTVQYEGTELHANSIGSYFDLWVDN
jgi:hypothetical protein